MVEFGRRSGRAAAKRAAAALERTPKHFTPVDVHEVEPKVDTKRRTVDEEPETDAGEAENDADADADDDGGLADGEGGDEQLGTDAEVEVDSAKSPSPNRSVVMVRRKRLGRPPKNRPADWDQMVEVPVSETDAATPRRRGRGGWRGRGGRKGQVQQVHQQPIDKDGNLMDIVNDEVDLPVDAEGETKVDKDGNLLGGREYRCRTFTVLGRGKRLYMLSTEPARCVGFRDSYLFFTKHRRLYKIIVDDEEKRDMIERDIIPHSYKGRAIGIVTARSVFREFGALIVVGGRRITDDYDIAKAQAEGAVEGEIADPNDHYIVGEPYNKNQYVAWHGASSVYHSNVPAVPQQSFKHAESKKRRVAVNDVNWQFEHAREASSFNSMLTAARLSTLNGVYDIHTNIMQMPSTMQPTQARAVQIAPGDEETSSASSAFPPLPSQVQRNFLVMDMYLETPQYGMAAPSSSRSGPLVVGAKLEGRDDFLSSFQGLAAVSDDIRDLLPPECRAAFDSTLENERKWSEKWGDEANSMCRRSPVIDKAIVPYAMTL